MTDERPDPDVVVETALRLLPVPDHEPGFWTRLEAALDAEPAPSRAEHEEGSAGSGGEPGRTSPGGPGPDGPDAAPRVAAAPVRVVELAPTPVPGVVPAAMRRRSNVVLSALAVAAAVAVVVAGASLVRSRTADDDPATEEVAEAPADGAEEEDPETTEPSIAAALGSAADDPAAGVVVEWVQALAAGDVDAAWALLGPASQAHWGSASGFEAERSALAEGYGAWASATPEMVLVTPLEGAGDGDLVVVTLVGSVEQEGTVATRADAFPVRLDDDGAVIELYASAGVMEIVVPEDAAPDGTRPPMAPADEIVLVVPEGAEPPLLRLDDGEVLVCGEAAGTELTDLEGASGQRCGFAPSEGLAPGDHVLTAAFASADGRLVTAHSASFTVR
jgi:hypothetical protein